MSDEYSIEIHISSDPRVLPVLRSAVERMAQLEGFGPRDCDALTCALDEAVANVIRHGYGGRTDQPIVVTLTTIRSPDGRPGLAVAVRDRGRQVDPATIRSRELSDVRPGGLGVHIIRSVMDEYDYSCPADGGMLLRMVKYVGQGTSGGAPVAVAAADTRR